MHDNCKILVLGASGMLGSCIYRYFSGFDDFHVVGTVRKSNPNMLEKTFDNSEIISDINVEDTDCLLRLFGEVKPHVVVNCIGVVKQLSKSSDVLATVPINSLLPHRLADMTRLTGARLIHFSTDCVFSGSKGMYKESDIPDANDVYGRSKLLGEVVGDNCITLRTSIIGHEIDSNRSLVDWFLSVTGKAQGYRRAIFSGLPTIEIARVIKEYVIPNNRLSGLYHLSSEPVNKYDLLCMIANVYGKDVPIEPVDDLVIDRSLNSDLFMSATGYKPDSWYELIKKMHCFR